MASSAEARLFFPREPVQGGAGDLMASRPPDPPLPKSPNWNGYGLGFRGRSDLPLSDGDLRALEFKYPPSIQNRMPDIR